MADSETTPLAQNTTSTPLADAEKIRMKRLAKLGQNVSSSNASQNAATSSSSSSSSSSKTPVSQGSTSRVASVGTTSHNSASAGSSNSRKALRVEEANVQKRSPPPKSQVPVKSFEDWQNDTISKVLRITLDKSAAEKSSHVLIYLNTLVDELKEEYPENASGKFKLSQSLLDRALFARLSLDPNGMSDNDDTTIAIASLPDVPLFDYLVDCWKSVADVKKNVLAREKILDPAVLNQRIEVLDKVKGLVVSYAGLILQSPEMFPQVKTSVPLGSQQLLPKLLAETDTEEGLPLEFIKDLAIRFENDEFEEVFGVTIRGISAQIRNVNVLSDFRPPLRAFTTLTEIKQIAAMLPTLSSWNPDHMTARTFELATLVGPFCRLSTFPEEVRVTEAYFTNPQKRSQADIDSAINSLRGTIQGIQKTLYRIFRNIVHASPAARGEVLNYFATAIRLNEKRAQMAVDPSTVGTDGFLTNLVTILLKLSEPFMDAEYSKIDRIDPEYFRKSNRINISQETKIKATQQEAEAYYKHPPTDAQAPNFISEIFFLNIAMHHYGLLRTFANYNNFIKDLSDIQKQIERLKEGRPQWSGTPLAMVNENLLKLRETEFEKMLSQKLAFDCQLMDPSLLTHSLRFYNLVMTWILRMVDPERKYPKEQIRLPLPENPPEAFVMLPEYFIEDITEYFLFIAKYAPHIIVQNSSRELIDFIIVFLKSSSYVKNPYLKARLVEILFYFTLPFRGYPNGGLGNQLNQYQMSLEYLMTALMSFYVEVEQTGAHTQFYDKFNIRYNISQVFKCIRVHHTHRDKLKEESRNNMDSFVRFANLLMNDATFLLDESLTKLAEIYNIQTEMDKEEWKSKPQQYRQERESLLQSLERQVTSYLTLGDETVGMLQYMSAEVAEPFLTPQIVDRLAAMLDYNLVTLVGPKCTELRVKEPEKYRFSRDGLLKQIIDIFLNLCNHKEFIQAVSRDGRSYSREIFLEANNRMRDLKTQSETNIRKFSIFVNKVEEAFKRDAEGEEELGEIPEEFLDPVMYDIMEDPVILPTSRTIVDRSTIATHLLSDSKDPFNRKPLKIEDVIPATELKERIEAFKAEKRKKSSDPPVTPYRI